MSYHLKLSTFPAFLELSNYDHAIRMFYIAVQGMDQKYWEETMWNYLFLAAEAGEI